VTLPLEKDMGSKGRVKGEQKRGRDGGETWETDEADALLLNE